MFITDYIYSLTNIWWTPNYSTMRENCFSMGDSTGIQTHNPVTVNDILHTLNYTRSYQVTTAAHHTVTSMKRRHIQNSTSELTIMETCIIIYDEVMIPTAPRQLCSSQTGGTFWDFTERSFWDIFLNYVEMNSTAASGLGGLSVVLPDLQPCSFLQSCNLICCTPVSKTYRTEDSCSLL